MLTTLYLVGGIDPVMLVRSLNGSGSGLGHGWQVYFYATKQRWNEPNLTMSTNRPLALHPCPRQCIV